MTIKAPPKRVIAVMPDQIEMMLALGLQSKMVGTAYVENPVPAKWQAAYKSVPVLSKVNPTQEQVLSVNPDLILAGSRVTYSSKGIGAQDSLIKQGIPALEEPIACVDAAKSAPSTWASEWAWIRQVGKIFDVPGRANTLIAQQKAKVAKVQKAQPGKGLTAFYLWNGTKSPTTSGSGTAAQLMLNTVGAKNIFASLRGNVDPVSWEKVVAANPDVIMVKNWSLGPAKQEIQYMESDPVLKTMTAVKDHRFVIIQNDQSDLGVRAGDGVTAMAQGIKALHLTR